MAMKRRIPSTRGASKGVTTVTSATEGPNVNQTQKLSVLFPSPYPFEKWWRMLSTIGDSQVEESLSADKKSIDELEVNTDCGTSTSWECPTCMVYNKSTIVKCIGCGSPYPEETKPSSSPFIKIGTGKDMISTKVVAAVWSCSSFFRNEATSSACACCSEPNPNQTKAKSSSVDIIDSVTTPTPIPSAFGPGSSTTTTVDPSSTLAFKFGTSTAPSSTIGSVFESGSTVPTPASTPSFQFGNPTASATTAPTIPAFGSSITTTAGPTTPINIQEAVLDANSNYIDWGTVFLTHLYKTEKPEKRSSIMAEILDLYAPLSPPEQEEQPFTVPDLDDFFGIVDGEKPSSGTTSTDVSQPVIFEPPPERMVELSSHAGERYSSDVQAWKQRSRAHGTLNNIDNEYSLSYNPIWAPSSCDKMANQRTTRTHPIVTCTCSRSISNNRGFKFRGQSERKEDAATPLPPLPNNTIMKNMLKWYIHSSISDLMWKISVSSEDNILPFVVSLLDLPIEEYKWCWPYISTQIYIKIMNNPLVPFEHQVSFWQSLHVKSKKRCSCKTVERLTCDLEYEIGLLLKGKRGQLLSNFTLKGSDTQSEAKLHQFFSAVLKFSKFLESMLDKRLINMAFLLENLLEASEDLKDVKSLTLFLATIDHVSSSMKDEFFECFERPWYIPAFDDHQLGCFQIYGKLKSIANDPLRSLPLSIVHFINGMVICRTESIHLHWRKSGVLRIATTVATHRPQIDATEQKSRGPKSSNPIRPIETLLQNDVINEFYKSVADKYLELRDTENHFASEGKTFF